MFTHVLVHYAEIGTKGRNRPFFENKLVENIKKVLDGENVERQYGRILIKLGKKYNEDKIRKALSAVFGISNFSFVIEVERDLRKIKKAVKEFSKTQKGKTFRITASRAYKEFPYTSRQINEILGGVVLDNTKLKVDLTQPDVNIFVEVTEKSALIYSEKIEGLGGLPVGTSGKAVSLLSGGIDSPVASWMMMKRGCHVVFVHFHMENKCAGDDKITKLVKRLNTYQGGSKLYMIPFRDIQMDIIKHVPSEYRMLIYRRMMFRIAEQILKKEKAGAFVTGDNLAQVASQTMENLKVIYEPMKHPILSPLMGFDKNEIIKIAEKIGTYKISILPYKDCCSFFVAEHPKTKGKIEDVKRFEKKLKVKALINNSIKKSDIIKVGYKR